MAVQHPVQAADLLAGQEAGEPGLGIAPDAARRVGLDMAAGHGMVEDLSEQGQRPVGISGRSSAAVLEPEERHAAGDAVEAPGPEGRKQLAFQEAAIVLLRRGLAAVVADRLPRAGDEIPEQRHSLARPFIGLDRPGRCRETGAAHFLDLSERRRAERHLPHAIGRLAMVDEGPAAGRADPYPETGDTGIPEPYIRALAREALQCRRR